MKCCSVVGQSPVGTFNQGLPEFWLMTALAAFWRTTASSGMKR